MATIETILCRPIISDNIMDYLDIDDVQHLTDIFEWLNNAAVQQWYSNFARLCFSTRKDYLAFCADDYALLCITRDVREYADMLEPPPQSFLLLLVDTKAEEITFFDRELANEYRMRSPLNGQPLHLFEGDEAWSYQSMGLELSFPHHTTYYGVEDVRIRYPSGWVAKMLLWAPIMLWDGEPVEYPKLDYHILDGQPDNSWYETEWHENDQEDPERPDYPHIMMAIERKSDWLGSKVVVHVPLFRKDAKPLFREDNSARGRHMEIEDEMEGGLTDDENKGATEHVVPHEESGNESKGEVEDGSKGDAPVDNNDDATEEDETDDECKCWNGRRGQRR